MHLLSGESLALSDGTGGSLLESDTLESLMHVQSVISDSILHSAVNSGSFGHHAISNELINNTNPPFSSSCFMFLRINLHFHFHFKLNFSY